MCSACDKHLSSHHNCTSTTLSENCKWNNSTVFWINGLSLCAITRPAPAISQQSSGTFSMVGCTTGVFTTLLNEKPECESSLLFSAGLGLPELVCMNTVTSTNLLVSLTGGSCVLNPAEQKHRPSGQCIVRVVFLKAFLSLESASVSGQESPRSRR